ncbi:sensor domain-containing diguanylate cyclase [Arcobacter sp. CECT 8986]|uniref:sensor domain-containing diguanylate cyclase n=1 Tax=Arcobacter sp. CECT 8986 TaxID=2044507 RepID=UPI0013E95277|nr:diguanylate cyclase [Arcobacter sp. CECT 8986]
MSIETVHNKKDVKNLVKNISLQSQFLNSTIQTYSKWDDAYDFLQGKEPNFKNRNFRNGAEQLKILSMEFLIYTNTDNVIKLCDCVESDTLKTLFHKTEKLFLNKDEANSIIALDKKIYYVVKSSVLKTDHTGKKVGYLYAAKLLNNTISSYTNTSFQFINLVNKEIDSPDGVIKLNNMKVKYKTLEDNSFIENYLELRDEEDKYITTLKVSNYRDYIVQGKETTFIFNIIIAIVLAIIFYLSYRYQIITKNYTEKLERDVQRRTKELKQSNKELHELAYKDFLTKIDNRRSFFIKVQKLLKDTIFRRDLVHIVMIDVDNFKQINDKYTHDIGDIVLKKFASILEKHISHNDLCARIGGEEFVIAFSDISTDEVIKKVEAIRKETEQTKIILDKDRFFNFTASFGISDNKDTNNIDKILHKADSYLYEVKRNGKNHIRYR